MREALVICRGLVPAVLSFAVWLNGLALSCGPTSLSKTPLLGATAALARSARGSGRMTVQVCCPSAFNVRVMRRPFSRSSTDSLGSRSPIHEMQTHLGVLGQHFEVALIPSRQGNLPGHRNARNQNVPQFLALRVRAGRPYGARDCSCIFIERQHNRVLHERLERMQLPVKGLPGTNRLSIAAKTLEDRHRANSEAPKRSQVRLCMSGNGSVPSTQFRQGVGIQQNRLYLAHQQPLAISGLQLTIDQPSISR